MIVIYGVKQYGREDQVERTGHCDQCGAYTTLRSYNTAAFFCVYGLPLVPMGRKRITDACPVCNRHYEVGLRKYHRQRRETLTRCLAVVKEKPADPSAAVDALNALVVYQQINTLNTVTPKMARQHAQSPDVQRTAGRVYEYLGDMETAESYLHQALALQDSPENREALAANLSARGLPAEAEVLLSHLLENPDAGKRGLFYQVVYSYLHSGRFPEALALLEKMEASDQRLVNDETQQALNLRVENAQKEGTPVPAPFMQPRTATRQLKSGMPMWVPGLVPLAITLALLSLYLGMAVSRGRARPMWLVNGTPTGYQVRINGTVYPNPPFGYQPIRVREGEIRIEVMDTPLPVAPEDVHFQTPFWSRPFRSPTVVIDPDRVALVVRQETIYSDDAPGQQKEDPPPEVFVGDVLYTFTGIHYPFIEFPATIQVDASAGRTRRSRLYTFEPQDRADMLAVLLEHTPPERLLDVLERVLLFDPDQIQALRTYTAICTGVEPDRLLALLKQGIALRPVRIDWHRSYQQAMELQHPEYDLISEYTRLMDANPEIPAFAYLLGRITKDSRTAKNFFLKSEQGADPIGYGYHALAYRHLCSGDFSEAVEYGSKALAVRPDDIFEYAFTRALEATGRYGDLLERIRQSRQEDPLNATLLVREAGYLLLAGQGAEANALVEQFVTQVRKDAGEEVTARIEAYAEAELAYRRGDTAGYLHYWENSQSPHWPLHEALMNGQIDDAVKLMDSTQYNWLDWLLVYSAAMKAGKPDAVAELLARTIRKLETGDSDDNLAAAMLKGDPALTLKELPALQLRPELKRVLAVALGYRFPTARETCFGIARIHNYPQEFPRHILIALMH